jgi:hypothetical protein
MELTSENLGKISVVNFGINEIVRPCRFMMIYLGVTFFFRLEKDHNTGPVLIFNGFINEISELFSLEKDVVKKCISDKGGGYLYATNKINKTELGISEGYGCVEYDHDYTISLLREELEL